jgi:hypothetical protein
MTAIDAANCPRDRHRNAMGGSLMATKTLAVFPECVGLSWHSAALTQARARPQPAKADLRALVETFEFDPKSTQEISISPIRPD